MPQIRTRHHDPARRAAGARVAGSRDRARRTLEAGAAARTQSPDLDERPDLETGSAVGVDLDERPDLETGSAVGVDLDERPAPEEAPDPAVAGEPGARPSRVGRLVRRYRPGEGEARATERPFRGGWPLLVGLVLVAALVALVVTAGLLARQLRHDDASASARDRALAAARTEAQAFLSYDYRRLDQDFAAAKAGLTGRFASEYAATSEQVVRPTATQYKAVVKAEVISLGVVDAAPDQVVVLAYVDQTTTSTRLAGPRVDANRVRMTLVPVQGRWKVAAVDAL